MALLGAHVSAAGGAQNAPGRGRDIMADAIQVFTANQNQWQAKPLSDENISGFKEGMAQGQPQVSITHDSYLINLCSTEEWKLKRARNAFVEEMDRSESLGIHYIVFHPGAHMGAGYEAGCTHTEEHAPGERQVANHQFHLGLQFTKEVSVIVQLRGIQGRHLGRLGV